MFQVIMYLLTDEINEKDPFYVGNSIIVHYIALPL